PPKAKRFHLDDVAGALPPIPEILGRNSSERLGAAAQSFAEKKEAICLRNGHRPKQKGVDNAEHRDVHREADRKTQHGEHDETWARGQRAERIAKVLQHEVNASLKNLERKLSQLWPSACSGLPL